VVPGDAVMPAILLFAGDLAFKTGLYWQKRTKDRQGTRENRLRRTGPHTDL
jgi:hypothetical protein